MLKVGDLVRLKKSHRHYDLTLSDLKTHKGLSDVSCETPMLVVDIEKFPPSAFPKETKIVSVLCNETVVDFISEKLTTNSSKS